MGRCKTYIAMLGNKTYKRLKKYLQGRHGVSTVKIFTVHIGAGSRVPGGAQAPPELFLAPPEPFEPPLTIEKIMH